MKTDKINYNELLEEKRINLKMHYKDKNPNVTMRLDIPIKSKLELLSFITNDSQSQIIKDSLTHYLNETLDEYLNNE